MIILNVLCNLEFVRIIIIIIICSVFFFSFNSPINICLYAHNATTTIPSRVIQKEKEWKKLNTIIKAANDEGKRGLKMCGIKLKFIIQHLVSERMGLTNLWVRNLLWRFAFTVLESRNTKTGAWIKRLESCWVIPFKFRVCFPRW